MILSLIVAAAENDVIGKDGQMPWRLPDESAYFRQTTLGHPVITGRKNYEAMGRPLPGRLNIVITRQAGYKAADGVEVVNSLESALALPEVKSADEVFIIGGQQIYEMAMAKADRLYLTIVHTTIAGGTAFFKYDPTQWREARSDFHKADRDHKYAFTIKLFERI
ncbi:MAG TPA: dihydrofolate reductase [Candidatus Saccharimonadales bacterium]|nr:dihydrofolate reductase [Candidatus Saccharimonadales bacterium]